MTVVQEMIRYRRPAMALDVAPAVRGLQATADALVQTELRRFHSRLRALTPEQRKAIRPLLQEMANKILFPVIRSLKRAAEQGDSERVAMICTLFDLPHCCLWKLVEFV
jgi:glutamyl-tRNA reductase